MKNLPAPFILMLMLFVHVTAAFACAPPPPGSASFTGPASSVLCTGTPYVLTNTSVGAVSYIWLNNANGQMTISSNTAVNPTITFKASGIYTVTLVATDSFNQNTSATATYTVVGPVPGNYAGNNQSTCGLSAIFTLGKSPVSGYSYLWSPGIGLNDSTIANPTVTLSDTTILFTLRVTYSGCSIYSSATLSVKPYPNSPSVTTNSPICSNEAFVAQATSTTPNAEIVWTVSTPYFQYVGPVFSTSNNFNSTGGKVSVYTRLNGCLSPASVIYYVVKPLPASPIVAANISVCEGDSFSLGVTTQIPGATYRWWGPNGFTSNNQSPRLFALDSAISGDYFVVSIVNGCESSPNKAKVTVYKIPTAPIISSNSPLNIKSLLVLNAISSPQNPEYIWQGPNGFFSKMSTPVLNVYDTTFAGVYSVRVVSSNGCTSSVAQTNVVIIDTTTTAIDPATALEVSLYPNPSTGQSTLKLGQSAAVSLTLNTALGQQVREYHFAPATEHALDFTGLPAGVYLLNGSIGGSTYQQRVVLNP
jgi:hypothetical protein